MPENFRALIFVLAFAVPAFYLGRQIANSIIPDREYVVWRNIWFTVTAVAFVSINFLIHAVMILLVCQYARYVRAASLGLYFILLFAVPLGDYLIGGAGIINQFMSLNNARLLTLFLLIPFFFSARGFERRELKVTTVPDWLVVAYMLMETFLQFRSPDVTITSVMRVATILSLDMLIPYFVFSRMVTSVADLRKIFLAFVIATLPLCLIAAVEFTKTWRLYAIFAYGFGIAPTYLLRDGILRGSATALSPIILGFIIVVATGCTLGLWRSLRPLLFKRILLGTLAIGLIATLSRGPWVGMAILLLVYTATGPNAIANLSKLAIGVTAVSILLLILPGGNRLLDFLPFIGAVDAGSVTYRQMLFDNAIAVIERYPIFGTVDYRSTPEMIAMTNGGHIIDIVNTYLEIALRYGLVGLGLYIGIFASIVLQLMRALKSSRAGSRDFKNYVRAAIASLIAMLVIIATVSNIDFIPYVLWSFAGLSVAVIRIGYKERSLVASATNAKQVAASRTIFSGRARASTLNFKDPI